MTYIIGDVHGEYDTLLALVDKLPKDAKLIFVGDLVDRGGAFDVTYDLEQHWSTTEKYAKRQVHLDVIKDKLKDSLYTLYTNDIDSIVNETIKVLDVND